MAVWFYGAIVTSGASTVVSGVGSAAAAGDASALSTAPEGGVGSATATGEALGIGSYLSIHHVALPRPAPGEPSCDC